MTYTYAVLPVSQAAFDEIQAKLRAGGYEDAFHEGATLIDMHGIAIQAEPSPPPPTEGDAMTTARQAVEAMREAAGKLHGYVESVARLAFGLLPNEDIQPREHWSSNLTATANAISDYVVKADAAIRALPLPEAEANAALAPPPSATS